MSQGTIKIFWWFIDVHCVLSPLSNVSLLFFIWNAWKKYCQSHKQWHLEFYSFICWKSCLMVAFIIFRGHYLLLTHMHSLSIRAWWANTIYPLQSPHIWQHLPPKKRHQSSTYTQVSSLLPVGARQGAPSPLVYKVLCLAAATLSGENEYCLLYSYLLVILR